MGQSLVAQPLRIHAFPKELWVRANHICEGIISELSIKALFLKLVVERICLGDVVRIPPSWPM
jgi:hypothetical protein